MTSFRLASIYYIFPSSPDPSFMDCFVWGILEDKTCYGKPTAEQLKSSNAQEMALMPIAQIGRAATHLKDTKLQVLNNAAVPIRSSLT